ncbi:Toprim domain-containing protein [Halogranum amylolyticum]|uniref:DNA primase DnaG n=1 Tax=Halogranum amylolyticum TaxID=660520 RepID=A0A1H8NJG6_9EURY|nr:DNA primase DnaG [Halogranum amylolyticum]SEO29760.1 Toprim domain-containing protein [Halogranum amylolyticum]
MDDTAKYLIHAAITADGVVERSDVVGAIFGQTEGLLGDDLDLRDLQQSSKVGRIDVQIQSENGQSYGEVTIASSLDKVETSILAASLETISRVGPCKATVEVTDIEDVRAAKRRDVVERAKELLAGSFDDSVMTSREILEEVRESVRVEDITEYDGYPAGPNVETSDAIIVVEGRADVLTLLRYGIKNAIAVEGTNVPESVAALTQDRNVTAFLDGDRGGELILRELAQVGHVDHVAFAPRGRSVEDLARREVMSSLRDKVPYETYQSGPTSQPAVTATDGSTTPAPEDPADPRPEPSATTESPVAPASDDDPEDETEETAPVEPDVERENSEREGAESTDSTATVTPTADAATDVAPETSDPSGTDESDVAPDVTANGETSGTKETAERDDVDTSGESVETPESTESPETSDSPETTATSDSNDATEPTPSIHEHVRQIIESGSASVRLLDDSLVTLDELAANDAFDAVADADTVPYALVVDDEVTQRLVDVSAQRGVEHIVGRSAGEFVKKPVDVRVRTGDQLLSS